MSFVPGWVFPGQGTVPSTRWDDTALARRLSDASTAAGLDLLALFDGPASEERLQTRVAQPLILIDCIVKASKLRQAGVGCRVVAGHSLGEYAALVAADVLDPLDALRIVMRRGELMDRIAGGMMAIVKVDTAAAEELCHESGGDVVVATRNSPHQTVVSGRLDALTEMAERVEQIGGRAIRLGVSGPFHSPLMSDAEAQLRPMIEACRFEDPMVPVVSSVTGEVVRNGGRLKELLSSQITASVEWMAVLDSLAGEGVTHVVEVGPGTVLAGIGKRNPVELAYLSYEEAEIWANSSAESP